jgi:GntR family transcriptional regulator
MAERMYLQIADDLKRKIEAGEPKRGSRLPTEIELREQYDASRNTIQDAIKWLTTHGLVETLPGRGTFVTYRITPLVTTLTGPPEGHYEDVYLAEVVARDQILRAPG